MAKAIDFKAILLGLGLEIGVFEGVTSPSVAEVSELLGAAYVYAKKHIPGKMTEAESKIIAAGIIHFMSLVSLIEFSHISKTQK